MNRLFLAMSSLLRRVVWLAMMCGAIALLQVSLPMDGASAAAVDRQGAYPYGKANPSNPFEDNNPYVENSRNNLKETADNVREKLNLDQPIPQSTKDFLNEVQNNFEDMVEPITGEEHGYYQDNLAQ